MRNVLVRLCAAWILCGVASPVFAQSPEASPAAATEPAPDAGSRRAREFQGDDIGQVLRLLARQAKINLAVGEAVKGTVSVRLENVTAMEAIEVLVHLDKLSMTKDEKGVYYVNVPEPAAATLDLLAKPEVAAQVAAYDRHLNDALCKEGFASNDALQLTAAASGNFFQFLAKKPDPAPAK